METVLLPLNGFSELKISHMRLWPGLCPGPLGSLERSPDFLAGWGWGGEGQKEEERGKGKEGGREKE